MINHIPSDQLTLDDLPDIQRRRLADLINFASTFDPNQCREPDLPIQGISDLPAKPNADQLRMALYIEWRRHNHTGSFCGNTESELWDSIEKLSNLLNHD